MNRLNKKYQEEIVAKLQKEFKLDNVMAVPKIEKIAINMGVSDPQDPRDRARALEKIAKQFEIIAGQKPQITKARKSIANFALREGDPVGLMVCLRGERMWQFLDKLISIVLPRVKDFRGVSRTAFDGHGNYSMGLEEQIIFPEIKYDDIEQVRSLQVNFVTSTESNEQAFRLLELLGIPFAKEEEGNN